MTFNHPVCRNITGVSVNPPRDHERVPMNVHPEVRARLRTLLFEPEMRAVGYSEFINRACERAEEEIVNLRRGPCKAVIHHGPGHQSTSECEVTGEHRVHQNTSLGRLLEWTDDDGFTGYFDENPEVD